MKDLGDLHYFLGVQVSHVLTSLLLHQTKYALDLLERDSMHEAKPINTPMCQKYQSNLSSSPYKDPRYYRSLLGALQYLTLTQPDISHSINYVA